MKKNNEPSQMNTHHIFKFIFLEIVVAGILFCSYVVFFKDKKYELLPEKNLTIPEENLKIPEEGLKTPEEGLKIPTRPLTIVTGSSSNHFCTLRAWLANLQIIYDEHEELGLEPPTVIVYDLGLNSGERTTLHLAREAGLISEFRTFNYSAYPAFFDIHKAVGQFAWKPAIIAEVARDFPGFLVWSDAGTIITPEFVQKIRAWVEENDGFLSPSSQSTMPTYTHPGVYEYYRDDPQKYREVRNCNGAIIGFDTMQTQYLIDQWLDCAMVEKCIAPPGSSLRNHRQDQAILTYLAARDGRYCNGYRYGHGMFPHQDDRCWDRVEAFETIYGGFDNWLREKKNNY